MNKLTFSIDTEPDIHTEKYEGITEGLKKLEELCDKYNIAPTLFVVASTIPKNKKIFKKLHKKGWEISLHGYSHRRFDDLSFEEKEYEIKKSIEIFKKHLGFKPKGFRAPQHSIDDETLDILEKSGFQYDSSYTPFNILQLFFFPTRLTQFTKQFFSKPNPYKIRKTLKELPVSSLLIPPVSLTVRIFPVWFLKIYFKILTVVFKQPIFYAHSWDFIRIENSKIDKLFPNTRLLDKLDYILSIENENPNPN
jgi:hypothetical protein